MLAKWYHFVPGSGLAAAHPLFGAGSMAQKKRSTSAITALLGSLATTLALALVFLTVAGFLGGIWWGFDLAAHFRVQYAALLLPVVAVSAGVRWRRTALVAGAALLVNLALIVPLYLVRPAPSDGPATLQILSFNVTASNPERRTVIDYLAASGADIIFLHESSTDWEDALSRSDLPYEMVSSWEPGTVFGTLALIGKDATATVLPLGDFGQLSVEVTIELDGTEIKVLGTHPLSPVSSARTAARDEQLRTIGEWAARQDVPVVVTGDFNASTWSHGFSLVTGAAGLINSQRGFGVQASWPASHTLFSIPIDHLVHSPDLTTVERHLGENLGSDHFPLFATVARAAG
ncbi:MAG: endonuclease/exonuclease/phosphatase family protein [Acidimicrobiia bacterium]|nr:endonuclease/exonuclease/phosphatase family protein [Acidimicrobiia bacterium]